MAASGQENDAILGVEFLDGGAPARGIAFTEDLLQIAQQ
jgi:hypothetical protein